MNQPLDVTELLKLRKVTRAVADQLRTRLQTHLATLMPLLQGRLIFGRHFDGNAKNSVRGEDDAFAQLRQRYNDLANSPTYALPKELESPLNIRHTSLHVVAADYVHKTEVGSESKSVTINTPARWVLFCEGFSPHDLRELVAGQATAIGSTLRSYVLQYLALQLTIQRRPNIVNLFEDLRFPLRVGELPGTGTLPIVFVESPITTTRASDDVILQSTELTGTPTFEEVLDVDALSKLKDPLRERVCHLLADQQIELPKLG
jgi:hypothetical protein